MGTNASDRAARRGLCVGTAIGAVTGALAPAFAQLLTQGWRTVLVGLVLGLFGAPVGAVVGFLCAIIPSGILASDRSYFLRHECSARLAAVSGGALLLVIAATYTAVHWHGNLTDEAIATVPVACGLVLGAASTDYVLRGGPLRSRCRLCARRAAL